MGLSRTVSEINGDFSRKLQNFPTPCILCPLTCFLLELGIGARSQKKTTVMGLQDGQKVFYSLLDTIPGCDTDKRIDRQTDGQTSHDGKYRVM